MTSRDNKTVLVVEDSDLSRSFIRLALAAYRDLRLLEASSVDQAWAMLHKTRVDVVLSDLHMPGKDGIELTRMIRAAEMPLRAVPIVIITIEGDHDAISEAMDSGANAYLTKPVEVGDLRPILARFITADADLEQVLIVGDPEAWPRTVSQALRRELSLMTHGAGDSVEAMHCLFSTNIDLVLVDLDLPHEDGIVLVGQLRRNKTYCDIPLITVGAASVPGVAGHCFRPLGETIVNVVKEVLRT